MSTYVEYFVYVVALLLGALLGGIFGFLLALYLLHASIRNSRVITVKDSSPASTTLSVDSPVDTVAIYYSAGALFVPEDMLVEYRTYLKSSEWRLLRKQALKRDSHRCVRCGYIGYLQVHHTNYHGIYENMNFTVDQLESVCDLCHTDIHSGVLPMKKD